MSRQDIETGNDRKDGEEEKSKVGDWIKEDTDFLMVVTTFIATMAFQIGTNPPGGLWQEEDDKKPNYIPGKSIMATKSPSEFRGFMVTITACFVFSALQYAVLFLKKWPVRSWSYSRFILYSTMGLAISSMGIAYGCSVKAFTPDTEENTRNVISFITMIGFPVSLAAITIYLQYFIKSPSS